MKARVAVVTAAVLIPLAIVAAALALRSDGSDKATIPVSLSSTTTTPEAIGAADIARYPYGIQYEAGADLPALGGQAAAYKLDGVATDADVDRLQTALGMSGTVLAHDNAL